MSVSTQKLLSVKLKFLELIIYFAFVGKVSVSNVLSLKPNLKKEMYFSLSKEYILTFCKYALMLEIVGMYHTD